MRAGPAWPRIIAALKGTPQPRPPYTFTLSLYGAKLTGCAPADYYRRPHCYLKGQTAVHDLCAPDILFSPFATCLEAEAFGSELIFPVHAPPNIVKPAARSADEFLDVPVADGLNHPSLLYLRESVCLLAQRFIEQTPICAVLTAPVDLPALVMGIDMWLETLVYTPEKAAAVIDKATDHFIRMANALLQDGAAFICLPIMFANPQILYPQLIDSLILPALHKAFAGVAGPIIVHHGGNPLVPYLDRFLSLTNVAGFALDHRDSLTAAREILGTDRLLLGNICGPTLSRTPPNKVLAKIDSILDNRQDDPHFIFATSAADIPWDTPPGLIKDIANTIRGLRRLT